MSENSSQEYELKSLSHNSDTNKIECVICFEDIEKDNMYITECIHYFDLECIYSWVLRAATGNSLCPTCKTPLNIANIVDTHNNKNKVNKWNDKSGGIIESLYQPPVDCATSHLNDYNGENNENNEMTHHTFYTPIKYSNKSLRKSSKKGSKKMSKKSSKTYKSKSYDDYDDKNNLGSYNKTKKVVVVKGSKKSSKKGSKKRSKKGLFNISTH